MTNRIIGVLLLAACAAGCAEKGGEHLPMKKMEDVMLDISIAEAYSTKTPDNNNFGGIKNIDTLAGYYKDILTHHGITSQQFSQSMNWYKAHPEEIDTMYAHLSERADKLNKDESQKPKVVRPAPGTPGHPQPQQGPPPAPGGQY